MKRVLTIIAFTMATSLVAAAGGPDIKPLPEIRPVKKDPPPAPVIEPLKEAGTKKREAAVKTEPEVVTPAQPSYFPAEDRVERVRVVKAEPLIERKVAVLFESRPVNAELLVNGLYVGSTPIQLPLRNGVHNVKMLLADHLPWERQVKVYNGLRVLAVLEKSEKTVPEEVVQAAP
ncbi:MAG: hypothetical protein IEMM0002_1201 [bacterium]|nr:MAG: hypothetical protein IEMM0002_1201 [bacterium]